MERAEQALWSGLQHLLAWAHYPVARLVFALRWEGVENVPEEGPAVVCPNHESFLDPPAVVLPIYHHRCRRIIRYMALDTYFHGGFGLYLRMFDAFPVAADRPTPSSIREALRTLRGGRLLGIFPEGGRSPDGRLHTFLPGAAHIAATAGVPLIPVTVNGTYEAWPRGRGCPLPRPIEVIYHPPIPTDRGLRSEEGYLSDLMRRVEEAVASRHTPPEDGG